MTANLSFRKAPCHPIGPRFILPGGAIPAIILHAGNGSPAFSRVKSACASSGSAPNKLSPRKCNDMPFIARLKTHLLFFCILIFAVASATHVARVAAQDPPKQTPPKETADPQDEVQDDTDYENLAPAAVELDVSKDTPLIRELYAATR